MHMSVYVACVCLHVCLIRPQSGRRNNGIPVLRAPGGCGNPIPNQVSLAHRVPGRRIVQPPSREMGQNRAIVPNPLGAINVPQPPSMTNTLKFWLISWTFTISSQMTCTEQPYHLNGAQYLMKNAKRSEHLFAPVHIIIGNFLKLCKIMIYSLLSSLLLPVNVTQFRHTLHMSSNHNDVPDITHSLLYISLDVISILGAKPHFAI